MLIKADKILYTSPTNVTMLIFNDAIHLEIQQQPRLFMEGHVLQGKLQTYYDNILWAMATAQGGLGENYCKCISPIDNVYVSLFKSFNVIANNQSVIMHDYGTVRYMKTVFQTSLLSYRNGVLALNSHICNVDVMINIMSFKSSHSILSLHNSLEMFKICTIDGDISILCPPTDSNVESED